MEELKSLIPNGLKRMIGESTAETLTHSCSSLLEFLLPLPQFQRVIGDLTDPELALCRKSKEKALDFKKKGNECFSKGDCAKALSFYSQALRYSPITIDGMDESFVATLYVNRASTMHKMGLLEDCLRDCNRAVVLSPAYAKAWYRRGKANASLKNYEAAISDLEISLSIEGSSSGKRQIKEELDVISNHFNGTTEKTRLRNNAKQNKAADLAEQCDIKLQCVTTPLKGRGMVSPTDVLPASLIHREEPLAAIMMKSCRETHCHFCFNELPADVLFCLSCTIPIYCSQHCLKQAGGEQFVRNKNLFSVQKNLPANLAKHLMDATLVSHGKCEETYTSFEHIHEHRHECGGAHWPAVLPPDVVLAGRVMVKFKERRKFSKEICKSMETLQFAHNYNEISPESKLELHLYAIVLAYCLQCDDDLDFPSIRNSSSKLVLLISQIKVNSMAIVRMKSLDGCEEYENSPKFSSIKNAFTSSVEQVQVGKAIYATGSLFNHSCQPNINAYFLSRTLFLRVTEFVPAWDPLELSYGPQSFTIDSEDFEILMNVALLKSANMKIEDTEAHKLLVLELESDLYKVAMESQEVGQLSFSERQELLKERYSFKCQCRGCSELNLSDIVINAFSCIKPNCLGAVLDIEHHRKFEAFLQESTASFSCLLSSPQKEDICKVAYMLLQKCRIASDIGPEHCLTCGFYRDLESLTEPSKSAMVDIKRLKDSISSKATGILILDILRSLSHLRSIRHPYSKTVAQAEDAIAEAFVRVGEFHHAMLHSKSSIEIIEKLYGTNHIVIGHELLKLVSIQFFLGDSTSICNIERLATIFSLYYGSHATIIFPYLDGLRRKAKASTS